MSADYWLGVATVPAVFGVGYGLIWIAAQICWHLGQHAWFVEFGKPPESEVNFHSRLAVRGKFGLHYGVYRTTSGWGSRWIAIGPVSVGRRLASLALTEKPPASERTPRRSTS